MRSALACRRLTSHVTAPYGACRTLRSQRLAVDWCKHRCELGASCKLPAASHTLDVSCCTRLLQLSIGATTLLVNEAGECTLPVSELTNAIVSECNLNADVRVIEHAPSQGGT